MPTATHTDEKDLLRRLQGGDHSAFDKLYQTHSKALYWKLRRMVKDGDEADELLQDLFVKVWENRQKILVQQSFEAYLYRIAQRMAVDYFRKLARQNRVQDEAFHYTDATAEDTEELLIAKETRQLLDDAIAQLPEQRQRAFILCKIEGKSHQEAAEIMGISPNTVHNHLVKAMSTVRTYLANTGETLSPLILLIVLQYLQHI